MATQSIVATTVGPTQAVVLDLLKFQHGQGMGLILTYAPGTTGTCTVEVSGDNVQFGGGIPTNWNPHDILKAVTASANSNIAFPITAVRLNPATLSAGGQITLSIIATDA